MGDASAEQLGTQLERILASPIFSHSKQLSHFLRYVINAAADGRASIIKEYAIGVDVFGRGKDFDPRVDTIVRVQAAKLRSKLLEYYAAEGASDPLVVTIPKGGYTAEIRVRQATPAQGRQPGALDCSRIAVLPFVNMSSDPENEYFSDGLTEELINQLSSVPGLQVVARTSAFRFKGRNEDLREVGAKLNAGVVMEGSVRRSDDRLRITAQLIDVNTGYHLFSKTYQRELKDVFALQDELAQAVSDEVASLAGLDARPVARVHATNLEAYNLYLRGMFALSNRFADMQAWRRLFHDALRIDEQYAPAWAGLAHGHFLGAWFYQSHSGEAMPRSKEAALRTLALDDRNAAGHASLGVASCVYEWNWAAAEHSFRRAIELQPSLAITYSFYAWCCLLPQSRMAEACNMAERALALDPFNPLCHAVAITLYDFAGRYDEALRQLALGLEVSPDYPPIVSAGAAAHEFSGRADLAIPVYRRLCEQTGYIAGLTSLLGHALAATGETQAARQLLARLQVLTEPPAIDIATILCGLREEDETMRWLELAARERQVHLIMVPGDPRFHWLRDRPRFRKLLGQMSLPAPAAPAGTPR